MNFEPRKSAPTGPLGQGCRPGIGRMKLLQGRFDEARELSAGALAAFQELGNPGKVAVPDFQGLSNTTLATMRRAPE